MTNAEGSGTPMRGAVAAWLLAVLALLIAMIIVGGLTRLTDSGLSITEWKPVTGAVPPLSESAWEAEFEKYRQIPEYAVVNKGMSLSDFKAIYWWEWAHRFLGRLIGVAFLLPFLFFLWRSAIPRALIPRMWVIFALGGFQGALGWFMVMSGLTERTDVSQYRLAAHLSVAFLIFAMVFWTLLDILRGGADGTARAPELYRRAAWGFAGLVFAQIILGAFVAGTDAGFVYNTWPLMDGRFVPDGVMMLNPWWINFTENVTTIQFQHRIGAYVVTLAAVALWVWSLRLGLPKRARIAAAHVPALVLLQVALGIWTLIAVVPVALGAAHQAMAVALFAASLWHAHAVSATALSPVQPASA